MPPTIPCFRSPRGGAAIAISSSSESYQSIFTPSSESYQSFGNTLIILSSTSVVMVPDSSASRGSDEAGQRCAPRHRRSPSPAPSVVPVRSATVATAASYFSGSGGHVATRQSPSPCSVLPGRTSGRGVVPASPSRGGGGDDEATSRPKRKVRYRKWGVEDELKVLTALAELRRENLGVAPQASVLLDKIRADGGLLRGGVDATDLSDKVCKLKKKFANAANKFAASGGRRFRNYRNRVLFRASMEVWPDLLPGDVAAAFLLQVA